MTDRILVPLDGSPRAERALSCAVAMGSKLPAELVLFRAISIPKDLQQALDRAGLESGLLLEHLETEAEEYLRSVTQQLLLHTGLELSCVVAHGLAAEAILNYARQAGPLLIVMASHGYSGRDRWTHGSVAERVLQAATVPVLLTRAQEADPHDLQPRCCRRILVPLDGSRTAEQVLLPISTLIRTLGCKVTLYHVSIAFLFDGSSRAADRIAEGYLRRVAARLRKHGIDAATAVQTGPVAETIVQFAETHNIDLIAMCTHGRTGVTRWTLGSVADRVLRAGSTPLFLVRAKSESDRPAREQLWVMANSVRP